MAKLQAISWDSERPQKNKLGQEIGRKGSETRARLLASTRKLIIKYGQIAKVPVRDIVRAGKVSQATFYSYFESVEAAALEVIQEATTSNSRVLDVLAEQWTPENIQSKCREFIERYFAFWEEHGPLLWARNVEADQSNVAFLAERLSAVTPVIVAISNQMKRIHNDNTLINEKRYSAQASVLLASLERVASVQIQAIVVPGALSGKDLCEACIHLMHTAMVAGIPPK